MIFRSHNLPSFPLKHFSEIIFDKVYILNAEMREITYSALILVRQKSCKNIIKYFNKFFEIMCMESESMYLHI